MYPNVYDYGGQVSFFSVKKPWFYIILLKKQVKPSIGCNSSKYNLNLYEDKNKSEITTNSIKDMESLQVVNIYGM